MDKEWTLSRQTLVAWRHGQAVPLDAVGEERLQPRDHRLGGSSKGRGFRLAGEKLAADGRRMQPLSASLTRRNHPI